MKNLNLSLGIALLIFLSSCSAYKDVHSGDYKTFYNDNSANLGVNYKTHFLGAKNYELHFQLSSEKLVYQRDLKTDENISELKLNIIKFDGYGLRTKIDSVSTIIKDKRMGDLKRVISGKMNLPFKMDHQNVLAIKATDLSREISEVFFLAIDTTLNSSANYLASRTIDGLPLIENNVQQNTSYAVRSPFFKSSQVLASSYKREFDLPSPPFSLKRPKRFNSSPESERTIKRDEEGTYSFELNRNNIIRIQDSIYGGDQSFFVFPDAYPKISEYAQMLESIRYITSKKEYQALLETDNKKEALDEFWLERAGSEERALKMIRTYYQRAENANRFFASHAQGWKTDRGLIFIIFGKPKVITKKLNSEVWNYGETGKYKSLSFRFVKVKNPFSDNDFRLIRKEEYKPVWYYFIEAWREGRIIN